VSGTGDSGTAESGTQVTSTNHSTEKAGWGPKLVIAFTYTSLVQRSETGTSRLQSTQEQKVAGVRS
jgi:hypothetical protein